MFKRTGALLITAAALLGAGTANAANPKLTLGIGHRYIARQARMYTHATIRVTQCAWGSTHHRREIRCQVYATGPFLHSAGHTTKIAVWWVDGVVSMEGSLWLVPGDLFTTL